MTIINKITNNLKKLMKEKVLKASNTNGLKPAILRQIKQVCDKRMLNKYETLNAINAIPRTMFLVKRPEYKVPQKEYKYRAYSEIKNTADTKKYNVQYKQNLLIVEIKGGN